MYKINAYITLLVPNSYNGEFDEIANYIRKETGLNYEVLSISKRNYDEDDSKFLFDLTLLFKVDKKNSAKLVCDLENRFMELYDYETKNVKILLNEVYVKLEKNKNS